MSKINSILDDTPPAHILVSGHSGAGKSTLAKALSEKLNLPHVQVDHRPEFLAFLKNNDKDNHLPAGSPKHDEFRQLMRDTAHDTLAETNAPAVIEGTQLAYLPPELLQRFTRIHVNPSMRQAYQQRLDRQRQKYEQNPDKEWTPEVAQEKEYTAKLVHNFHKAQLREYDKLPATLKYKPHQDIDKLIRRLRQKSAELLPEIQLQEHQQRIADRISTTDPRLLVYHGLGSGKSLSSLAAAEAAKEQDGEEYGVVVPASLRGNFDKEIKKFTRNSNPEIMSYTGLALGKKFQQQPSTLIMDEAHRLRNPGSASSAGAAEAAAQAKRLMLLTGSPITNSPTDLANLLSMLHNKSITPEEFEKRYIDYKTVRPGLFGWLRGVKPGVKPVVKNEKELRSLLQGKVDYQPSKTPEGVDVKEEVVRVPLSPAQDKIQKAIRTKIPPGFLWKLDQEFPLSKDELAKLNSFLTGLRQVSLSTQPFRADKDPAKAFQQSAKLQAAFQNLQKTLNEDKRKKAIIYSNFIDSGLAPYAAGLEKAKIPHAFFHGGVSSKARQAAVDAYNTGKLRALLIGPAGAEGLSTKGTSLIQLLDPHWHESRSQQARGRGLRFDSHRDLPEELKNVQVQRYLSASQDPSMIGKLMGYQRERTGDEVLEHLTAEKEQLNEVFRKILKEEGDKYRKQKEQEKTAASKLRSMFKLLPTPDGFQAMLGNKNIGRMNIDRLPSGAPFIARSDLAPEFRGMGLGRKLYGEVMRRMPNGQLVSGESVSPSAQGVWRKMMSSPSYRVTVNPAAEPVTNAAGQTTYHISGDYFLNMRAARIAAGLPDEPLTQQLFNNPLNFFTGSITPKAQIKTSTAKLSEEQAKQRAELPAFQPDFTPGQLHRMGVYKALYEKEGPRLASLGEWKPEWVTEHDPKGWLEWYQNYNSGRRIPDEDARQIKRWASFKARHGGPFVTNPTPRRGWALQHWAIDPAKLVSRTRADGIKTMLQAYQEQELKKYLKRRRGELTKDEPQEKAGAVFNKLPLTPKRQLSKKKRRLLKYPDAKPQASKSILDDDNAADSGK